MGDARLEARRCSDGELIQAIKRRGMASEKGIVADALRKEIFDRISLLEARAVELKAVAVLALNPWSEVQRQRIGALTVKEAQAEVAAFPWDVSDRWDTESDDAAFVWRLLCHKAMGGEDDDNPTD